MELSLVYFAFIFLILLSTADPTEFDNQCPTSRRLLLFGGSDLSKGEKKSPRISSSSKPSIPSSPPKYARSSESNDLMVYIRPETSSTARAHKGRSYTHLLKAKPHADKEKKKVKRSTIEQKKSIRKKNSTQHKSSPTTKSQELVAIDDQELNRCRALLHLDIPDNIEEKIEKKEKKPRSIKPSKIENDIEEETKNIKKKVVPEETSSPVIDKKTKITKVIKETNSDEKKPVKVSTTKTNDNRPVTSSIVDIPIKTSSSQSTTNTKSKRDHKSQSSRVVEQVVNSFDTNDDQTENSTDSVVNRAFHFVKNMFQLSDDSLNGDPKDDNHLIDIANEQQQQQHHHHHHSRKLLTIDEHDTEGSIIIFNQTNEYDINLNFNNKPSIETTDDADDLTYVTTSISKRQLLSVKTNKQASPSKSSNTKEKKAKSKPVTNAAKPKVGWAYRYRISRYLNAQKMKRTGNKNKGSGKGEEKSQHSKSKQKSKKTNSKNDTKVSKRKLLGYCATDDSSECNDKISNPDIVNSVLISETFIPKRQLLASKSKHKDAKIEKHDDNHHQQQQQTNTRRQMKSFEESTDPIAIVNSYDRGLFKPRVGWQFRYRVSRYIDSLRENIREDQERLKLGLQAIKRKTPQELSGRRKRVLDKPFAPDVDELKKQQEVANAAQENKPHAGWRYRYRISKMNEAKKRGDFIDDEEEKRKAFREQKQKQNKSRDDNRKPIEGEEELDSELRQISDEGRRVGWAYRYRIRRKLDDLKHQQAITGKPFDITTLGGKREKKIVVSKGKSIEKKKTESVEQKPIENKKSVGWEYRYRISKMKQAQKGDKSKVSKGKQLDRIPVREQMDPELTRLTPEQRAVGWKYRYRSDENLMQRKIHLLLMVNEKHV
ncbi:hypothetical protein I4U23_008516 [Adineta vaga]|nr:hypothetical protein I4U23_008516 [Adineta vaga]